MRFRLASTLSNVGRLVRSSAQQASIRSTSPGAQSGVTRNVGRNGGTVGCRTLSSISVNRQI
ncbi:hypothetical protein DPMN_018082 [Dreissena polymorpha]|uniref:Uncharacterized protein n=1 Tax=Dreissena polymorpha TaxID=45954 RepID=A0A9D4NEH5_DREPO|nr:hypothetical protein DPMN_018082 [Dreissena polymorpha]